LRYLIAADKSAVNTRIRQLCLIFASVWIFSFELSRQGRRRVPRRRCISHVYAISQGRDGVAVQCYYTH